METLILPISSSVELNEGQPPQPSGPPTGNFAEVLQEQSSSVAGEDTGGKEMAKENPDVSSMGFLLPAIAGMIPRLSSFLSSVTAEPNSFGGNTLNNEGQPPQPSGPPTGMIPWLSSFLSSVTPELNSLGGNRLNNVIPPNMNMPGFNAAGNPAFPSNLPNAPIEVANHVSSLFAGIDSRESPNLLLLQGETASREKMNQFNVGGIPSEAPSHLSLQQGKTVPSEKGIELPAQELLFDSEPDHKMILFANKAGSGSWGAQYSFTENFKGRDGFLFPEGKFADIANTGNRNSAFPSEGFQDPGGSQKLSLDMGGDLKIRFGPSLTESGKEEFYQQIGRKVVWSIHNNTEKVKITLDPPDLGNIYMEIYREKETIRATLWADNPTAKVALEASQGQLQKIMQNEGFKLEQFNVFLHENTGTFQERRETPLHPHPGNPHQDKDHEPEMRAAADILAERTLKPKFNSHHVDVWA